MNVYPVSHLSHIWWTLPLILLLLASRQAFGRLNVNVALNKPTASSSAYWDPTYGIYWPQFGNDGNPDPIALKHSHSCSITPTSPGVTQFWTVDLGLPLAIAGVQLFNRAEGFGYRSNYFVVGMLDVYRHVDLWDYDELCGQYPNTVPDGAAAYLQCSTNMSPHQHVVVHFPGMDALNFCELEVYVQRFDWSRKSGYRMNNRVAETFQVDRQVHCMSNCTMSPVCDSYNFRQFDNMCQFNTHATPLEAALVDIAADNTWDWWSPNFVTVV